MDFGLLGIGIAAGIAVTMPLGPVNLTVIRAALRGGMAGGLAAASGSILGDGLFALIAAYGARWIEDLILSYETPLQIAGGLFLIVLGIHAANRHVKDAELAIDDKSRGSYVRGTATCFFLTITQPGALVGFFAIFGGLAGEMDLSAAPYRPLNVVAGIALGALGWWLFVTYLVTHIRGRVTARTLHRISLASGVVVAAVGFAIIFQRLV
jgi:threonine/homoserine/homoserine lactone efflux protein